MTPLRPSISTSSAHSTASRSRRARRPSRSPTWRSGSTRSRSGRSTLPSTSTAQPASRTWTTIDAVAPETTLGAGPASPTELTTANFTFTADEAGVTFECSLDTASFTTCTTPHTVTGLSVGRPHLPGAGQGCCRQRRHHPRGPHVDRRRPDAAADQRRNGAGHADREPGCHLHVLGHQPSRPTSPV